MLNVKLSEQLALLGFVNPVSQAAGSAVSGWLSAQQFQKFLVCGLVGVFGASATVDANIQQAQDSSGTGAKAFSPAKAIVQMLAAGGNNKQFTIDLDAQEFDVNNGFCYFQVTITVGTAATLIGGVILGGAEPRNTPVSSYQPASVTQQV